MYTLTVEKIEKVYQQLDGKDAFDVTFSILLSEEKIDTKRLMFPITNTKNEIKEELSKYLLAYEAEQKQKEDNIETEKIEKIANDTINALTGINITV